MNSTVNLMPRIQTIQKLKPLRQDSDELPSFEEAFNPDYLRQFFRVNDSSLPSPINAARKPSRPEENNIPSLNISYSPFRDQSFDDTGCSVADTNDTYISPQKEGLFKDNKQMVSHLMQLARDSNVKQCLETARTDPYTQGIYTALNCVNYTMEHTNTPKGRNLDVNYNKDSEPTTSAGSMKKRKVFLIIRNAPASLKSETHINSRKVSDKSTATNTEKSLAKGKGQRKMKERLQSADNINVNNFNNNNMSYFNGSLKRKSSYAISEGISTSKKLKGQKNSKENVEDTFEFDLDADFDFKPGFFDVLPAISFDEILNEKYPEFAGGVYENSKNPKYPM